MKKIYISLILIFMFFNLLYSQDSLYIYKNNKVVNKSAIEYLDSILFEPDNHDLIFSSLQNDEDLAKIDATCIGPPGALSTIYSIPVNSKGIYKIQFEIKFPHDIQTGMTGDLTTIATLPYLTGTKAMGGFYIKLRNYEPCANAPFAQPLYRAGMVFQPVNSWNNYRADYTPSRQHKPFVGFDAFSIRYKGDITLPDNQDICMSITDSGLLIYHSTNNSVILSESFPTSSLLCDFIQTMKTKTSADGVYSDLIEFESFSKQDFSTNDIVRFKGIPIVANYDSQVAGKGWNAFPCFVSLYDSSWHKVEVLFNANGDKGTNVMSFYLDGFKVPYIDDGMLVSGNGIFNTTLTLGCKGCQIRNYRFENNVTKSSEPSLVMYMLHAIVDGEYDVNNGAKTSFGRLQDIINSNKLVGAEYVTINQIEDYLYDRGTLPQKCYSIIHDDSFFLADTTISFVNKFRELYAINMVKPAFALILTGLSSLEKARIPLDKDIYNFHIHAYQHIGHATMKYMDLVAELDKSIKGFNAQLGFKSNNITQPGGSYDYNTIKIVEHKGFTTSYTVGSLWGNCMTISKRFNCFVLPRVDASDRVATFILP